MNDFFQALSFHGARKRFGAPRPASAPLRCIMQSFDEIPFTAFRPASAESRRPQKLRRRTNHKP